MLPVARTSCICFYTNTLVYICNTHLFPYTDVNLTHLPVFLQKDALAKQNVPGIANVRNIDDDDGLLPMLNIYMLLVMFL